MITHMAWVTNNLRYRTKYLQFTHAYGHGSHLWVTRTPNVETNLHLTT